MGGRGIKPGVEGMIGVPPEIMNPMRGNIGRRPFMEGPPPSSITPPQSLVPLPSSLRPPRPLSFHLPPLSTSSILKDNHKCYQDALQQNCAICLENMFFSRDQSTLLPNCNHWMYMKCFNAYVKTNFTCPICCKSLYKMQEEEINNFIVKIK
jgi:hypothetical protein